ASVSRESGAIGALRQPLWLCHPGRAVRLSSAIRAHALIPTTGRRGEAREGNATLVDGAYGSDNTTGLVWAFEFSPGCAPRPIGSADLAARVGERCLTGCLWLHFSLANSKSERWLREHLQLPNAFYESLCDAPSTRVEAIDETLVAVMRDVPFFGAE